MKKVTVFYDNQRFLKKKKRKKIYHYILKKPYNWLISDELAEKIKSLTPPVMITVLTSDKNSKKQIISSYVAIVSEVNEETDKNLKPLEIKTFTPEVWSANEAEKARLNRFMKKIGLS
ncbi:MULTISPECIES: hypothetical protein [Bacilli]|uniref:hypothetical protein n=1 Tax=Bacilli TaxID=91061 RepID=UPI0024BA29B9|nr:MULTISPECIES: hypothetical protein [Bacilli]